MSTDDDNDGWQVRYAADDTAIYSRDHWTLRDGAACPVCRSALALYIPPERTGYRVECDACGWRSSQAPTLVEGWRAQVWSED